ncbi:MAG: MFS transporter [Negativicutes bacterium]|nr:MFS transporter [Negativicutes bacterium]
MPVTNHVPTGAGEPTLALTKKWTMYHKYIVGMLWLAMVFAYMDRINLSIAMPVLIKEYGVSPSSAGFLLSAFNIGIALSMLAIGPVTDILRPKKVFPAGVALWSIATWAASLSPSVTFLAITRAIVGVGEASVIPSASRIIADIFRKEDRGKVVGIYFSGTKVGLTIGAPLAAAILSAYGWKAVFYVTGFISAAWLLLWLPIYRESKGVVPPEIPEEDVRPEGVTWLSLLTYRSVWGVILGQAGYLFIYFVFITWMPSYLVLERKMSILNTGFVAMLPFLVAVFSGIYSGWLADRWISRGGDLTTVRRTFIVGGFLFSTIFIIIAAYMESTSAAVLFLILSMGALGMASPNVNALPIDIAPRHIVSSVAALQNFGGNIGGAIAPILTGFLYQSTGSFQTALIATGIIALVIGAGGNTIVLGKIEKSNSLGMKRSV